MYGFWKNKRIVLFDTLLAGYKMAGVEEEQKNDSTDAEQVPTIPKGCSNEEVVAVLGHELGHWKLGHTLSMLAISEVSRALPALEQKLSGEHSTDANRLCRRLHTKRTVRCIWLCRLAANAHRTDDRFTIRVCAVQ
jgi:antirestriction protein ArdC